MAGTIPAARQHLIDAIADEVRRHRTVLPPKALVAFINSYYRGVDEDDLREAGAKTLAMAAISHVELGKQRRHGQPIVRVWNPDVERDGWSTPRTVVEVVTDDMPFLVDSLTMVLNGSGLSIHLMVHPVLHAQRDGRGRLTGVGEGGIKEDAESWQRIEVDRFAEPARLEEVQARIIAVLDDVRVAVADWPQMRARATELATDLSDGMPGVSRADATEASAFLAWLADNQFTFLGARDYRLERGPARDRLIALPGTGLGLLRTGGKRPRPQPTILTGEIRRRAREPAILVVTKANSVSTVHRATYLDYIGVKTFDPAGRVTGERRFIGLFTSSTYSAKPHEIPLLEQKVRRVVDLIGVSPVSHDGKALLHVLETYPRDELFQSSTADLVRISRGVVNLYERRRVRVFLRRDPYRRFFSCLIYVPRDRYNTQARVRIETILREELHGIALESQVQISESTLARLHTLVRTDPGREVTADAERIETLITETLRTWSDRLRDELLARLPADLGAEVATQYAGAFPAAYQEEVSANDAIMDIGELRALPAQAPALGLQLRPGAATRRALHLRLYRRGDPLAMSDLLPMLENFDLRVQNERPYRIASDAEPGLWIQDLEVTHAGGQTLDPEAVGARFEQAFFAVWNGQVESDGFNRLVLAAGLDWRQAMVLRAVCRYLLQTGLPFSQRYMESVLSRQPFIAQRLSRLFEARFDPALAAAARNTRVRALGREIDNALDQVTGRDDDRIIRAFRSVIAATLRTNHYQRDATGAHKKYLSLKLEPRSIPELPKPRPMFEIWVYSPRVEGVHLRMGMVARGGLRWSDRREDFRTEILGLMKAQNVKNTVIVPVGAKGGFVPRQLPASGREEIQREGTECYRIFIQALLDITDNVVDGKVAPPAEVVRYDGDDPYLVVAADKGTATFSDTANALAAEYRFWLGDAFASGGSAGYDHKKMAITARGGWECVKRHFRELGIDIQAQDFTAAGIGDMAGDVFGNAMLLSRHIRLQAAFNHQHIFLDPEPDPARSFRERARLFRLPRSTWADYERRAISKGGGVYPRDAKQIPLSPQARALLGIDAGQASPPEIIRAILKLPVDLIWNGGIGTYVKASHEAHSAIGDRANDALRVDGRELRCRVVGEGGNLGLSQLGRIEYAQGGGRINTDFVDNSGGVDCSDHEVNIKILLDVAQRRRKLRRPARDRLLAEMTEEVAALVLRDNYLQSQAISLQQAKAADRLGEHAHLIRSLERDGVLDRALEYLPTAEEIEDRRRAGEGLTRPELSMVLAYAKIALNNQLVQSDVPEDHYLSRELDRYFPDRLTRRYSDLLREHRLKREIIATATTNSIVNRMGPNFVARTQQDTGADAATVARAYTVAREVFDVRDLWRAIEQLDNRVPATVQYAMMHDTVALLRQVSYWLIQRHRRELGIEAQVERLRPGVRELSRTVPGWLGGLERSAYDTRAADLVRCGVPPELARTVASSQALHCAPDIVELASARRLSVEAAAHAYVTVGSEFGLDWLRERIEALATEGHWHAVARGSLREGVYESHRRLAQRVLSETRERDPAAAVAQWTRGHAAEAAHARGVVNDIRSQQTAIDFASISVALQAVRRLASPEG
ncbi:MAG TPA: NAD-glutamate dehydrogenase [Steroidobacteraceae bacterium]|jgi:glutamate dehydrogenase|nr:NAD-glutamate dehydrogenase [Steroidobacteraceae bacterium]